MLPLFHIKMKDLAEQELKILETQHPTQFQDLKLELKAFIRLFDEQEQEESFRRKEQQRFHDMSILTQESSSQKREKGKRKRRRKSAEGISGAMEKAEACLRKIERLKSFFCSSNNG